MTALRSAGDPLEGGRRYAMDGDTYLTASQIGERADALFKRAQQSGRIDWLVYAAHRLRLMDWGRGEEPSTVEAVMVLAAAHVGWSDICFMKS